MNGKQITLLSIGLSALAAVLIIALIWISLSNREVRLRNQIGAQQDSNKVVYDKTWKIIKEQAGIADQYREAFKDVYPALMEGRYGNERGGALMSFIKEHNPTFDASLYKQVSNSIEAQRTTFTYEQRKLRDLKNAHDSLLDTFPGSILLAGRPKVAVTLVTSDKTEGTFSSGKDNETFVPTR